MAELFDRRITVEIGEKGKPGILVDGLRVRFKVEQTSDSQANKARIEIYNLSKTNRQAAEKPGNYLVLKAGYGQSISRVFEGDIPIGGVLTHKQGPDFITTFDAGDGQKAITEKNISLSFAPGTNIKDVFKTLASSFGLADGPQVGIKDETFLNGLSLAGKVSNAMDILTAKQGLRWSVQDGVLQIHPVGKSTGKSAILLSANTGLIESPKRGDKKIEIKSLLQPSIRPGALIAIDTAFLKGEFVCDKVIHEGDNYDRNFFSNIEIEVEKK